MPFFTQDQPLTTRDKLRQWAKSTKPDDYVVIYELTKWANEQDGVGVTGLNGNVPAPDAEQAAAIEAAKTAIAAL